MDYVVQWIMGLAYARSQTLAGEPAEKALDSNSSVIILSELLHLHLDGTISLLAVKLKKCSSWLHPTCIILRAQL